MNEVSNLEGITFWLTASALYFIPMAVAFYRNHHSKGAITALNVILGWTGLGWIAALIWSLTGVRRDLSGA